MPWKGERDPYKIWLSEVILQQTRVEQGMPYYLRFVAQYPTVAALAASSEDALFKLWEGLGYYSRARNLHAAAKYIQFELNGQFPDTYSGIRALKGVGDYTAAAIASFAFNLPHAVLDGNVYRVLARYFCLDTPSDGVAGKKMFAGLAQSVLDPEAPGRYNQAIMDFGALQCTPGQPNCGVCPLRARCAALAQGRVRDLPVRARKPEKRERYFVYVVMEAEGSLLMRKRMGKDIWRNLYEFPLLEMEFLPERETTLRNRIIETFFMDDKGKSEIKMQISKKYSQTLTHQLVSTWFCTISLPIDQMEAQRQKSEFEGCLWFDRAALLEKIAVPRVIDRFLKDRQNAPTLF